MSPHPDLSKRLALAIVGGAALLAAGAWILSESRPSEAADDQRSLDDLLAERASTPEAAPATIAERTVFRAPIPEEDAARVFATILEAKSFVYDPHTYFARPGGVDYWTALEEHPEGRFHYTTNSLGMREESEPAEEHPDLRILVTGDSHTDGVCNADESFSNRLEALLAARDADRSVEVLNAGAGGFSFYNYVGVLDRFAELEPDVFVVAIYGGNDFLECLKLRHYFDRTQRPVPRAAYWERVDRVRAEIPRGSAFLSQAFSQLAYLDEFPDQAALAEDTALAALEELDRTCRERGVRLVVAYIPPLPAVKPEAIDFLPRLLDILELDQADVELPGRIADAIGSRARELGVAWVDLRPAFRASDELLYWKEDLHIDLRGHTVVADELLARVEGSTE